MLTVAADLLGLADWHLNEAATPSNKNEAEQLLASSCEALREFLIATIQAGNEEPSYRDLAALINDIDNYFIDSISRVDDNHGWTPATDAPDASLCVTVFTEYGTIHLAAHDDESGYAARLQSLRTTLAALGFQPLGSSQTTV